MTSFELVLTHVGSGTVRVFNLQTTNKTKPLLAVIAEFMNGPNAKLLVSGYDVSSLVAIGQSNMRFPIDGKLLADIVSHYRRRWVNDSRRDITASIDGHSRLVGETLVTIKRTCT